MRTRGILRGPRAAITLGGAVALALGAVGVVSSHGQRAVTVPVSRRVEAVDAPHVARSGGTRGEQSGCGWSLERETLPALATAYGNARGRRATPPDVAFLVFDAGHDATTLARGLRERGVQHYLGERAGEVLTPDGLVTKEERVVALVAADLGDATCGVGASGLEGGTAATAAQIAYLRALDDARAGVNDAEPALVLFRATRDADAVQAALVRAAGPEVAVLGGTTAAEGRAALLANGLALDQGVAVLVLFASRVAWCEARSDELVLGLRSARSQASDSPAGVLLISGDLGAGALEVAEALGDLPWLGLLSPRSTSSRSVAVLLPGSASRRVVED